MDSGNIMDFLHDRILHCGQYCRYSVFLLFVPNSRATNKNDTDV